MATLDELQQVSIEKLTGFFTEGKTNKKAFEIARLAVSSLSAVGRIKATERARDGLQLMVIKHITEDKKLFQKYVEVSMPHLNPAKLIEA